MSRGSSLTQRQYTLEFKVEALRLAESAGPAEAARRLGIPDLSLGTRCERGIHSRHQRAKLRSAQDCSSSAGPGDISWAGTGAPQSAASTAAPCL